jgi:hypothetical protein
VIGSVRAGVGGSLAWWALTGEGNLSGRAGPFEMVERAGWRRDDLVHDASADSFAASGDAQAFAPTAGIGLVGANGVSNALWARDPHHMDWNEGDLRVLRDRFEGLRERPTPTRTFVWITPGTGFWRRLSCC